MLLPTSLGGRVVAGVVVVAVAAAAVALSSWAARLQPAAGFPAVALDPSRARPQGDFLVGAFPEPAHLDPFTTVDAAVRTWVVRLTHDTLRDLDPRTGAVRAALAESITVEPDGTVRIALRPDVEFADGTPLRAEDVAFSHACARTPGLPPSAMVRAASMLATLEATGPHRLVGRGLHAHWAALDVFATGLVVVSRAAVERALVELAGGELPSSGSAAFADALARLPHGGPGSGPYMLAPVATRNGWERGRHLDLVQNPRSWRRRAMPLAWNLAGFRHLFVTDRATQLALARRDALDWLTGDARTLVEQDADLRARFDLVVYDSYALGHYMVAWNCRQGPLADVRVRRAVSLLFDREAIAQQLLQGDARPAACWFEPGTPECPPDLVPPRLDVEAAVVLLREAGYGADGGAPLRLEVVGAAQDPLHRRILELAQPAFAAAGVELDAQMVEAGVLLDRLQRRAFMGLLAVKYHPDPWIDPWPHFHSTQTGPGGGNWMGFADDETDRLLDAARAAPDAAARQAAYRRFCQRVHELQPVALLVHPRTALLLHRRFQDADVGPVGLSPEAWWVPRDAQLHR